MTRITKEIREAVQPFTQEADSVRSLLYRHATELKDIVELLDQDNCCEAARRIGILQGYLRKSAGRLGDIAEAFSEPKIPPGQPQEG